MISREVGGNRKRQSLINMWHQSILKKEDINVWSTVTQWKAIEEISRF